MHLARLHVPFDHPDWVFEVKYDGFRSLAHLENGPCRLVSRRGTPFKRFADLCSSIAVAVPSQAILDGEIACLETDGKPQFRELMRRQTPATCELLSEADTRDSTGAFLAVVLNSALQLTWLFAAAHQDGFEWKAGVADHVWGLIRITRVLTK